MASILRECCWNLKLSFVVKVSRRYHTFYKMQVHALPDSHDWTCWLLILASRQSWWDVMMAHTCIPNCVWKTHANHTHVFSVHTLGLRQANSRSLQFHSRTKTYVICHKHLDTKQWCHRVSANWWLPGMMDPNTIFYYDLSQEAFSMEATLRNVSFSVRVDYMQIRALRNEQ